MLSEITQSYDLTDATLEILFMLVVAFLLGYLLSWIMYKPKASEKTVVSVTEEKQIDNLKIIEGIGPKIESLLHDENIYSFADIMEIGIGGLEKILEEAGPKYNAHDPKTWPDQAELAYEGKWAELKEYQDLLNNKKDS